MTRPTHALRPDASAAFAAYREMVEAHREQVGRLAEELQQGDEFLRARVNSFRPGVLEIEEWEHVAALARPEDAWLDIGAGAGRFVVPLSARVARVIAIESSAVMREALAEATSDLPNVDILDLRWPPRDDAGPRGNVALAANVLYDATELESFLEAMERHADTSVVVVSDRAPRTPDPEIWEALFGEAYRPLPALRELLAVLGALGRRFEMRTEPAAPVPPVPLDVGHRQMRWRYGLAEGSERDRRLRESLIERYGTPGEMLALPPRRAFTAVVWWQSS
ncbi:MAG: hypothetical protein GEU80_09510 [Dehalococcoidia bacterium]|nr:hypothetical protein [Dehalococcoidia bacterium]